MARGKYTCKILKEIRRQIAEANGIEFATSECRYKGDCLGTCPKCEAEVRYLEQQLRARSLAGKAISLAGISAASLAMLIPMTSEAHTPTDVKMLPSDNIVATRVDSVKVKGTVKYTNDVDSIVTDELIGATVVNLTNGKGTATDIDGKFEIAACKGDSIQISFIGYFPETICVKSPTDTVQIVLTEDRTALQGEVVFVGAMPARKENHYLDLNVIDEKGNPIDPDDLYIESPRIYENGEEDTHYIHPDYVDEKHPCRIYWDAGMRDEDGQPLKEATFRIEAEGYDDPVIIKVKFPKRNAKKTIKFKHKKK